MAPTLRAAEITDALYVVTLEELCMRFYAESLWGTWQPSATEQSLDLSGHQIIEMDGIAVGCVASVWHHDHLFIKKLYIDPPYQGKRIGAAVLRIKCDEATTRGLPTKLSVLTSNPADRFYRREGFSVESETHERRRMVRLPGGL